MPLSTERYSPFLVAKEGNLLFLLSNNRQQINSKILVFNYKKINKIKYKIIKQYEQRKIIMFLHVC